MKILNKFIAALILLTLSVFAYSSEFLDEYKVNVNQENIRIVPNGRLLGILRQHSYFNVIKIEGGWFYSQREFYVRKSAVRRSGDELIVEDSAEILNENDIVLGSLSKGARVKYISDEGDRYFGELKFYIWIQSCVPTIDLERQEAKNLYDRARVYRARGMDGIALRYLNRAVELQPNYAQAYFLMGIIYTERYKRNQLQADFELALSNYDKVIKVNPDYPEAYVNIGNMHFRITEYEEAIQNYKKALDYDSRSIEAIYNLAKAYSQIRDFKKAEEAFLRVLQRNPRSIEVIFSLAEVYDFLGEPDKAIKTYAKFIEINPQSFVGYYNTACLYARSKKKEEALNFLKKAVEFMPITAINELPTDPDLENIKDDTEFKIIIRDAQRKFRESSR